MKRIKINESQYRMLMESGAIIGDDTKNEYYDTNQILITPPIHDGTGKLKDRTGKLKNGKTVIDTDKISSSLSTQSWANGAQKGGVAN